MSFLDWLALTLSALGILLNAKKNSACWPVWILSTLAWAGFAMQTKVWSLLLLQVIFFVANCYGWYEWRKPSQPCLVGAGDVYDGRPSSYGGNSNSTQAARWRRDKPVANGTSD